jgi:hypothetical protein
MFEDEDQNMAGTFASAARSSLWIDGQGERQAK